MAIRAQNKQHLATKKTSSPEALPTFLDHIYELRRRLFWVVASILVFSSASYSFVGTAITYLSLPLGGKQLYYLTPAGGLAFTFKICMLFGVALSVPIIIFHIYKYLEPMMDAKLQKSAVYYTLFSIFLALSGSAFAYFIALPLALNFLTSINLQNITAMLTVDSYLSFVMTYLLGGALLFQIPLVLMIINRVKPLKPKKLLGAFRFIVLGAFIAGAILSPTPDIINQSFLAVPIMVMYLFGVILIWVQNRGKHSKKVQPVITRRAAPQTQKRPAPTQRVTHSSVVSRPTTVRAPHALAPPISKPTPQVKRPTRSLDGIIVQRKSKH